MRRVRHDFRRARHPHDPLAAEQVFDGGGRNGGARPERIDRDALCAQFARETQHDEAHAGVGDREKWFSGSTAYSIAKYGMSLVLLGLAGQLRATGIAVNALWPRTTIAPAALTSLLA